MLRVVGFRADYPDHGLFRSENLGSLDSSVQLHHGHVVLRDGFINCIKHTSWITNW